MTRSRLSLGELANVWVDEPGAPFQIALAGVFDGTPFLRGDGTLDAVRIHSELARRAGRVPALRRKVVWTRLGQGRPYWVDDPAFDPERHISCASVAEGRSFTEWCAQGIVRPLDRDRPLWRIDVLTGLPDVRFGVLIVVHHAVADGLTGVALAGSLLDSGPHFGSPRPPAPAAAQEAQPQAHAPGPRASRPWGLAHRRWRQLTDAAADFRGRAPLTSLSRPIGPRRRLATVQVPLEALHEAGHQLGVTVNDLLLAAITGGLRDLLGARGDDLTGLVLRASVPVGARTAGQPDGILLIGLPVGEPGAVHRLAAIHEGTARLKARLRTGGGDVLDVLLLPTPAARLAVRWMRRIAGRGINLFVTNVPGPATPLWLAGARLLEAVPVAPLLRGVPLGIAALSYAGTLHVSIDADAAVNDLDVLTGGIERSFAVLLGAARSGAELPAVPASPAEQRTGLCIIENGTVMDRDPAAVFAYCTDPAHAPDWNPRLLAVEKLTDGPIGPGTRFRMTFGHGVGDSTVTYLRFDPPFSWAAQSAARWLDVHLEGHVEPVGSGSRLVLRTHLQPRGPLRPLAPVLRRYMHRVWNRNLAAIKDRLERPEGYPRPGGDHQEAAPLQP